jgi:NAD(P)-dependent dehydrogenase (short-subunit alcohol dehydrogenase family)
MQVASHLLREGANVIAIGRSKLCDDVSLRNNYHQCDMADSDRLSSLIRDVFKSKKIDGCAVAAGVSIAANPEKSELQRFKETISTNLTDVYGALLHLKPFLNIGSSVVLFSSINSQLGFPNNVGYVSSKAAIDGLTRALATDWAENEIRVNSLQLGYFPTLMTKNSYGDDKKRIERASRTILGRWGDISEIYGPLQFLLSRSSSYLTGQSLPVDGGWMVKGL